MRDILEPLRIALGDTTAFGLAVVLTAGDCRKAIDEIEQLRQRIAERELDAIRLRTKINTMLEIISDELPKAMRRRVGARFNAELGNEL